MESVALTSGTFFVGDGVHVQAPSTVHISLNNVRISKTWEHQKTDFVQGNSGNHSCSTDEIFVFHLLKVHAQFCLDPSCKCRCRRYVADGTEMTNLAEGNIFMARTMTDLNLKTKSSSSPGSVTNTSAEESFSGKCIPHLQCIVNGPDGPFTAHSGKNLRDTI